MTTTYLQTYPIPWPIFSTKNYVKDNDGWWHWRNRKNKKTNKL